MRDLHHVPIPRCAADGCEWRPEPTKRFLGQTGEHLLLCRKHNQMIHFNCSFRIRGKTATLVHSREELMA